MLAWVVFGVIEALVVLFGAVIWSTGERSWLRFAYVAWGCVIVAGIVFVLCTMGAFAAMVDRVEIDQRKGQAVFAFTREIGSLFWVKAYYVLKDYAAFVGATLGLGGVAWSAFFKAATKSDEQRG